MRRLWIAAGAATVLYFLFFWALQASAGVTRSVVSRNAPDRLLEVRRVGSIELPDLPLADNAIVWSGAWSVPGGAYDLALDSRGEASWTIDNVVALQVQDDSVRRTVLLERGFHRIEIKWTPGSSPRLAVAAAPTGETPRPLPSSSLITELPSHPWLRSLAMSTRTIAGWIAVLTIAAILREVLAIACERLRSRFASRAESGVRSALFRAFAVAAVAAILGFGALLRLDAIAGRFDAVPFPAWLRAIETRTLLAPAAIRPAIVTWSPEPFYPHRDGPPTHYHSDPYTYLEAARAMTSFYTAHFREPVFPFATKISLALLGGQDTAVSYTSTAFSVLAIWLTYLLGATLWSRPVGIAAACALCLDRDTISLASLGWRDDAYMAAFVLCAYLMLRYVRTAQAGALQTRRIGHWQVDALQIEAVLLGVGVGLTVLTRIMAVTFVLGGAGWILLTHVKEWRRHVVALGIAALTATMVAAPYFVNCWRVFGDPLYTFNVHGEIYSVSEGNRTFRGSTSEYVRQKVSRRPMEALDTIARGISTYPFQNKFHGLNVWHPEIGPILSAFSLAGLLILAAWPAGRLLLVITATGLLPFSLTWPIDPDYRFTVFVYPVLLLAACCAFAVTVRLLTWRLGQIELWSRSFAWRPWTATLGAAAVVAWFIVVAAAPLIFVESLNAGEDASLTAGTTDRGWLRRGWSQVVGTGNVRSRVVVDEATMRVPLPVAADYSATIRMDPFPRPVSSASSSLPTVEFVFNGAVIGSARLTWSPERVGAYDLTLPKRAMHADANELVVRVVHTGDADRVPGGIHPGLSEGAAAALWYLRVHQPQTR